MVDLNKNSKQLTLYGRMIVYTLDELALDHHDQEVDNESCSGNEESDFYDESDWEDMGTNTDTPCINQKEIVQTKDQQQSYPFHRPSSCPKNPGELLYSQPKNGTSGLRALMRDKNTTILTLPGFDDETLPRSQQGYIGLRPKSTQPLPYSGRKEELVAKGYRYVPASSERMIFCDQRGRQIIVRAPRSREIRENAEFVTAALQPVQKSFRKKTEPCRRGIDHHSRLGFSLGMGNKIPFNFKLLRGESKAMALLLANPSVLAHLEHVEGLFQQYMPGLRNHYRETNRALMNHYPCLRLPYSGSSFAATTINLGPQTVAHPHTDCANLVWGTCTDSPFGDYDWTKGGQLVLHGPRLILELRPGDAAFFPSACIEHENIPIGEGETRYSIISYSAGALFLHRDQGFQSFKSLSRKDRIAARLHASGGKKRWEQGMALYESLESLFK